MHDHNASSCDARGDGRREAGANLAAIKAAGHRASSSSPAPTRYARARVCNKRRERAGDVWSGRAQTRASAGAGRWARTFEHCCPTTDLSS